MGKNVQGKSLVALTQESSHARGIAGMSEALAEGDENAVSELLQGAINAARGCMIAPATGYPIAARAAAAKRILDS